MSKRNWKKLTCKLLRAKRAELFWGKLALAPVLLICCIHSNFQFKIHRTRNQGLSIEISRKVPKIQGLFKDKFIFKDFSRKTQNSRTFQGLWEPCIHLVFYKSEIYASKWLRKYKIYVEKVAARCGPHSNPVCVCGGGGGSSSPTALSKVCKYGSVIQIKRNIDQFKSSKYVINNF